MRRYACLNHHCKAPTNTGGGIQSAEGHIAVTAKTYAQAAKPNQAQTTLLTIAQQSQSVLLKMVTSLTNKASAHHFCLSNGCWHASALLGTVEPLHSQVKQLSSQIAAR